MRKKEYNTRLCGKADPLRIVQEIEITPYCQMVYAQTRICIGNGMNKVILDFEIQTDHLISIRRADLVMTDKIKKKKKKRTCPFVVFAVLVDHRVKNHRKRKERHVLRPCQRNKKAVEHEGNGDAYCDRHTCHVRRVGNQKTSRDHTHFSINKIGQNTQKSTEDLRRFSVTHTPAKDHQLMLEWKTHKK